MKKPIEYKLIVLSLVAHLWFSNSELLIASEEMNSEKAISLYTHLSLIFFALSYSAITAYIVFKTQNIIPVLMLAALDGFAVYMRINVNHPDFIITSGIFYGIYTALMTVLLFYITRTKSEKSDLLSETKSDRSETQSEKSDSLNEVTKQDLIIQIRKLQNRLNATKDEAKKSELQNELITLKNKN